MIIVIVLTGQIGIVAIPFTWYYLSQYPLTFILVIQWTPKPHMTLEFHHRVPVVNITPYAKSGKGFHPVLWPSQRAPVPTLCPCCSFISVGGKLLSLAWKAQQCHTISVQSMMQRETQSLKTSQAITANIQHGGINNSYLQQQWCSEWTLSFQRDQDLYSVRE